MNVDTSLHVVHYDWDKGMQVNNKFNTPLTIDIVIDGETQNIKDVRFYDTVRGFIQTDTTFYMPKELA